MKNWLFMIVLAWVTLFLILPCTAMASNGFTVGPSSVNITLPKDGTAAIYVYVTSSFDGELIVGTEDLPVSIEPKQIEVSGADNNREIKLVLSDDESLEVGQYFGKITFLPHSESNVLYGVRIKANVSVTDVAIGMDTWVKRNLLGIVIGSICIGILFIIIVIFLYRRWRYG